MAFNERSEALIYVLITITKNPRNKWTSENELHQQVDNLCENYNISILDTGVHINGRRYNQLHFHLIGVKRGYVPYRITNKPYCISLKPFPIKDFYNTWRYIHSQDWNCPLKRSQLIDENLFRKDFSFIKTSLALFPDQKQEELYASAPYPFNNNS